MEWEGGHTLGPPNGVASLWRSLPKATQEIMQALQSNITHGPMYKHIHPKNPILHMEPILHMVGGMFHGQYHT